MEHIDEGLVEIAIKTYAFSGLDFVPQDRYEYY